MKQVTLKITDIIPYENNPRYNEEAVFSLEESIKQVGYCAPIVVDEDRIILSGHTRHKALWNLGYNDVECIMVEGLTEEQKRKYRLLDNKTAEIADWDTDALIEELEGLDFGDLDVFEKEMEKAATKLIKEHELGKTETDEEDELVICPRCGKPIKGFEIDGFEEPSLSYEEFEQEEN